MRKTTTYLLVIGIVLTSGCATIFKGSEADIRVTSSPSNARILVDDVTVGATPATVSLDRKEQTIKIKKKGFDTVPVKIDKSFDFATTVLGNFVFGGVIGIVVDLTTGAAYSLDPAEVDVTLADMRNTGIIDKEHLKSDGELHVVLMTKSELQQMKDNN